MPGSEFGGSQRLPGAKKKSLSSVGTRINTGHNMRKVMEGYEHTSGPSEWLHTSRTTTSQRLGLQMEVR